MIAGKYISGWFLIDLISVLPFDLIFELVSAGGGSGMNRIARFARIGKLQKLIKISRMSRIVRLAKIQNKFVKSIIEMLKIN